ncbi:MAG: hypothetical protein WCK51_09400 [Armatimonadota bacterium]
MQLASDSPGSEKLRKWLVAFLCLVFGLSIIAAILMPAENQIMGDGKQYFAQTRSLVFDHDMDIKNDLIDSGVEPTLKPNGMAKISFACGAPLLWIPGFYLSDLAAKKFDPSAATGLSKWYTVPARIASSAVGVIAFFLAFLVLRSRVSERVAALSVATIALAGNQLESIILDPANSHTMSMFATSLFLYVLLIGKFRNDHTRFAAIGLTIGLCFLARWQEVFFIVVPIAELGANVIRKKLNVLSGIKLASIMVTAMLIVSFPQLKIFDVVQGSYFKSPQGSDFLFFTDPKMLQVLFSPYHGLFLWHPIFFVSLLGLPILFRKDRLFCCSLIIVFLMQLYLNSVVLDWSGTAGFGHRRFFGQFPVFVLLLGFVIEKMTARNLWVLASILFVLNVFSWLQLRLRYISTYKPPTVAEATYERFLVPVRAFQRVKAFGLRGIRMEEESDPNFSLYDVHRR